MVFATGSTSSHPSRKPQLGFLLIIFSYAISFSVIVDIFLLYLQVSSNLSGSTMHSFFYYYTTSRGVYFNALYTTISFAFIVLLSFTAGIHFLGENFSHPFFHKLSFERVFFLLFIFLNYLPFQIIMLFSEVHRVTNLVDNLFFLIFFYLLSLVYYYMFKNLNNPLHRKIVIVGLLIVIFGFLIEFLGYLIISNAPTA